MSNSDKNSTTFSYLDQTYSYEDDRGNSVTWKVKDIIDHVKDIKPELIKVELFKGYLDYVEKTYDDDDWLRVKNADLKYPIIVGAGTFTFTEDRLKGRYPLIFDGVHRLIKSKMNGVKYISAIITNTLPPPVVTGKGIQLDGMSYKMTIKENKMAKFNLAFEGQEQDLELEHDSRDIEYESLADSPLSPLAGRAFNNAIDDSESLSRMNDVLENSDLEDIPESSRAVIQTSMEGIRSRLLGGIEHPSVAVEGFSNQRELKVAIEKNKSILSSVWTAIKNFFIGIYNWIAQLLGKKKATDQAIEKDITTMISSNNRIKKLNGDINDTNLEQAFKDIEVEELVKENEKNLEKIKEKEKVVNDLEKQTASIATFQVVEDKVEEPVIVGHTKEQLQTIIARLNAKYERNEWDILIETSDLNKVLNFKSVKKNELGLIVIDLPRVISNVNKNFQTLNNVIKDSVKDELDKIDQWKKAFEVFRNTKDDKNKRSAAFKNTNLLRESTGIDSTSLRDKFTTMFDGGGIFKCMDDNLGAPTNPQKILVLELKSYPTSETLNNISIALKEIKESKSRVKDLNDGIKQLNTLLDKITIDDFQSEKFDEEGSKDYSKQDNEERLSLIKSLMKEVQDSCSHLVSYINYGDTIVKHLVKLKRTIDKKKSKHELKSFEALKQMIVLRKQELAALS